MYMHLLTVLVFMLLRVGTSLSHHIRLKRQIRLNLSMSTSSTNPTSTPSTQDENIIVHVRGNVNQENVPSYYSKTIGNAKNSILENGIRRFDVLSGLENPGDFLLIEAYRNLKAPDEHKLTSHYNSWREAVATQMTAPRTAIKYKPIYPPAICWDTDSSASNIEVDEEVKLIKNAFTQTIQVNNKVTLPSLLTVVVEIEVKAGTEAEFIEATINNCKNSLREPGVYRFDFLQEIQSPTKFCLVEVYNTAAAPLDHKKTTHYATWAKRVESMMRLPRQASKYATVYPSPVYWHRSSYLTHPGEGASSETSPSAYVDYDSGLRGLSAVAGGSFGFLSPKLLFGRNIAGLALATAIKDLGILKPFIITGKSGYERYSQLLSTALGSSLNLAARYAVTGEPTVEDATEATKLAIELHCDAIIAIGGGSAMDLGKAVSALVTNSGDIYEYLETVGKGLPIKNKPLPCITIPTTSGTGAEATKNAVLKSIKFARKASIRHDTMLPVIAIVDPTLTLSCSPATTAHVGLDTLCQLIEPFVSNAANPITDALTREGIRRAARSLRTAVINGQNIEAREDMSVASVLGGLALANSKLGAVHGFAAVLGGMFESAPHGAICAALLPHVMRKNAEKLTQLATEGDRTAGVRLGRFEEVARMVTGIPDATVLQGVIWIEALVSDLEVPCVSRLCGMTSEQILEVCEATAQASSTKGNPIPLTVDELKEIMLKAL